LIGEGKTEREMKRPHDLSVTNSRPDRCPQKFIRISYASGMSAKSHTECRKLKTIGVRAYITPAARASITIA